jgi:hypothetical protein
MMKSIHASKLNLPEAAAHPISGGMAPRKAPTSVHSGVLLLSGVYKRQCKTPDRDPSL